MRLILDMSRLVCATLAVIAMALPAHALPWCRCCEKAAAGALASAPAAPSGCCCKAKGQTPKPPGDDGSGSRAPQSCPSDCKSPCSAGKPITFASALLPTEFRARAPMGMIAILAAQQPSPPTLDGLLRPPRI